MYCVYDNDDKKNYKMTNKPNLAISRSALYVTTELFVESILASHILNGKVKKKRAFL